MPDETTPELTDQPVWGPRREPRLGAGLDTIGDTVWDTVVVGAGLTGLTTALLLARAGQDVAVVEARTVGAVTTGNTTGKVSLLQGTRLSRILERQSEQVATAYVEANREGQAWLARFCDDHGVPYQHRTAATYAPDERSMDAARGEHAAAQRLGIPVVWKDDLAVPFPHVGASTLADQLQLDAIELAVRKAWPLVPFRYRWQPRALDGWKRTRRAARRAA